MVPERFLMPFNYYFSRLLLSLLSSQTLLFSLSDLSSSLFCVSHRQQLTISSIFSHLSSQTLLSFRPPWFFLLFLFLTHNSWRLPVSSFCCSLATEEKVCVFVSGFGFGLCLHTKRLGYVWWRTMGSATTTSDESPWRRHHWWLSLLSLFSFLLFIYFSFGLVLCWFVSW